jgi:peptide/nickel transport system substrate-binding protein
MSDLPTGTVTFLFTDIEGSTQLLKQLGGELYSVALADHQRILRQAFAGNGGHEIDTQGDSFFVAFRRAKDAVAAAVECQQQLAKHDWRDGTQLRVRMGIHTGEPAATGERYVGLGVHRAARICAVGHGGQVLLSQTTRELLREDPIPNVSLRDLGEHQLKDLDEPERIYQLFAQGLQEDFPQLKTSAPAPFEGREGELAEAAVEEMARRWRRPGRRVLVGATFAAAVVGVAAGLLLTQGGGSSAGAGVDANSVGVVDSGSGKVVSQISVRTSPNAVAVGPDAVWVTNTSNNTISRIDPSTNAVRQTIDVGRGPVGVAVGGDAVWVTNGLDGTVSRVDPTINREVKTIPVGNGRSGVAYGEGFVWVTNSVDGTVSRIDPSGNRAPRAFPAVAGASGIAVGFRRVWVVSQATGTIVALGPRSGQVLQRIAVGVDPSAIATGADAVWVANRADGTVYKIDPRTGAVASLIPVGSRPTAIAVDSKTLWVASQSDGKLYSFDPATDARIAITELGNPPAGVALTPGNVYAALQSTGLEHRGGELRVLSPSAVTTIDPARGFPPGFLPIVLVTNDGLVGFRKVGGIEGDQIVPDLAVAIPAPTDGGKTYTFQVRSGIHYSNGELVQPDDFKRAVERLFEAGNNEFERIVGADRCVSGKPCDLGRGIVTDRGARTVTFHLSAPDPDFLANLAQPEAFAAPAGTPAGDVGTHPIPATGPYRIAFFGKKTKTVRLVRNRFFREWSPDAQPQGYPDSISFSWRLSDLTPLQHKVYEGNQAARLRAVEQGAADIAQGGDFPALPKNVIDRLSVLYPSQLHVNTELAIALFFLNTRVAPFTDVRVRRAVNIAFDRQAFARKFGRAYAPTCRYLPPGTLGYQPTCPYGAGGVAGLEAARRLVRSSGTAGAHVTVWVPGDQVPKGRFLLSLLHSLGYQATLKVIRARRRTTPVRDFDAYFRQVSDSRVRAQTGYIAWIGDVPSPILFLPIIASCAAFVPASPGKSTNLSEFCDHSIDAQMARASVAQAQDPPSATVLWQRVERALAIQAPYVPVYNPRNVDFVSKRVGNYQYNPTSGALLSQLWVK